MIKTLHITNAYHSSSGGIRTFYHAMLEAADRRQRHLRLVVPAERSEVEVVGRYAKIHYVRSPRSPLFDARYRIILPHRFALSRSGEIWQILREEEPDLIEVCDKYLLCYLGGTIRRRWLPGRQRPALVALSCERMDDNIAAFVSQSPIAKRLARWYIRRVYLPQFDGHIAVSQYTAGELATRERAVYVAPMGLECGRFAVAKPNPERRARLLGGVGIDPRAIFLIYAGRLSPEKNVPLLIDTVEALGSAPDWTFHLGIAGEGPLLDWLIAEGRRRAPGRIHSLGHIRGRDELAAWYASADAFLHPNPREPFGIAPLEAMAAGLPLVAPLSGGILEYASSDNAWLAEPSGAGFAEAIRQLVRCPSVREEKRARARARALAFDWRGVTEEYFRLYDRIYRDSCPIRPVTGAGWRERAIGRAGRWMRPFRVRSASEPAGR